MHTPATCRTATLIACLGAAAALASCTSDAPTDVRASSSAASASTFTGKVSICHQPGTQSSILEVAAPALSGHLGHGDYVTTLVVDHSSGQSDHLVHFTRIGDALSAARATRIARGELVSAACRITIAVSAGNFTGTAIGATSGDVEHFPLVVDVPDITLHGALVMGLDVGGRATGIGDGSGETRLVPLAPLPVVAAVSTPLIVGNTHPGGSAGSGLTIEGFVFQSGHNPAVDAGGQGILSVRADGLTIRGNRFEPGFTESVDVRGGSAEVAQNHLGGGAGTCDICIAGPGSFHVTSNYLLAGGIPGILIVPATGLPVPVGVEPFELPAAAEATVDVRNNEVHDHLRLPVGTGIRIAAIGIGAPNVHGMVRAVIQDNLLVNNRFGMIVEGGFPLVGADRRGDVDVTYDGNVIQHSCQAKLLVSLARHTTGLGLNSNPYLLNSTYRIALGGNVDWSDVWYSHPAGFGNTLVVDGQTVANGSRQFYSATGCPAI